MGRRLIHREAIRAVLGTARKFSALDRKKATVLGVALLAFTGTLLVAAPAQADLMQYVYQALAWILEVFVNFFGSLLLLAVWILIQIAQYNGFVTAPAVGNGWIIVRDVTNMFFIVILLVLAFGTMLGMEQYSIGQGGKALSRLLIVAIVINFSRTICGLFIDFAQVIMLTFVNGFAQAAGGNFTEAFGITSLMQGNPDVAKVEWANIVLALLLALILTIIALGVIIIMTITLAIRIIYLWLLVILSPIAFFLKSVPGGQASTFYGQWWAKFTSQVVVGPVLAFFLWLGLITVAVDTGMSHGFPTDAGDPEYLDANASEAFSADILQKFIISCCLFIGGVMMANQVSGGTVGMAKGLAMRGGRMAVRGAKAVGGAAMTRTALGRAAEKGLSAMTKVPLARYAAGAALTRLRGASAAAAKRREERYAGLTPEESARVNQFSGPTWLMSPAAQRSQLGHFKKNLTGMAFGAKTEGQKNRIAQNMDRMKALAGSTNDVEALQSLAKTKAQFPDMIIDKSERDPAKRDAQTKDFQDTVRRMRGSDAAGLRADQMSDEVFMTMNPKALAQAAKNGSSELIERLNQRVPQEAVDDKRAELQERFGRNVSEDEARTAAMESAQAKLRENPEMFRFMSKEERNDAARRMSAEDASRIDAADIDTEMLAALAAGPEGANRMSAVSGKLPDARLNVEELRNNADLAQKISQALKNDLSSLPTNMANAVRDGLGKGAEAGAPDAREAYLDAGGSMEVAFKDQGYNPKTGNFSQAGQKQFESWVSAKGNAARVPSRAMTENDGFNDAAFGALAALKKEDISSMAAAGKSDQVFSVIQAAEGISDESKEYAALTSYLDNLPEGADKGMAERDWNERHQAAKANAQNIIKQLKEDSTLRAQVQGLSFTGKTKQKAVAGAKAVGGAAVGAAGMVKAVPGATKEALKGVGRAAGAVATEAGAALDEAKRQAKRAKRKISRIGKKV